MTAHRSIRFVRPDSILDWVGVSRPERGTIVVDEIIRFVAERGPVSSLSIASRFGWEEAEATEVCLELRRRFRLVGRLEWPEPPRRDGRPHHVWNLPDAA